MREPDEMIADIMSELDSALNQMSKTKILEEKRLCSEIVRNLSETLKNFLSGADFIGPDFDDFDDDDDITF